ncbi:MAG: Zn-ribbon domain-containing OB-fold protein, partial [Planctomycetota bacterium]|jgi:hypothetical protein|nr:Zn-ribbon domain-containing OB-fold protein [Planctomycetota bacterium]
LEERPLSDYWFHEFLKEEKLMGSKCTDCGALFVPPRQVCMHCSSSELEWQQMQGTGKLVAFSSITMAPPHMEKEGYGRDRPYCTGVIALQEGPRMVARIEGVDAMRPENIKPGITLRMCFLHQDSDDGKTGGLVFMPSDETEG